MKNVKWLLGILFIFAQAENAMAQKECESDIQQFCSQHSEAKAQIQCLKENQHRLSNECKNEIQRLVQAAKQAAARGGGAMSSFGGMNFLTPPIPLAGYEGRWVSGGDSPSLTENRFNVSSPVAGNKTDLLSMSLAGAWLHWSDEIPLNTGTNAPKDLYRAELGAQFSHQMGKGKSWGLRGSLGFATDRPFQNGRDMTVSAVANYTFPGGPKSFWTLSLFYSNNTSVASGIPLPGVMYIYAGDEVRVIVGFPLMSVQWTPVTPWSFSLSAFGVNVSAEAAYGTVDQAQFFTGFQWVRQVFMLENRVDSKDRLSIEEKKVMLGVRTPLFWSLGSEFSVGRSFNREVYIGQNLNDKDKGAAILGSGYYLSWNLRLAL